MTTFTLNDGTTYTRKPNGYCYKKSNGTMNRIGQKEFNAAFVQHDEEIDQRMQGNPLWEAANNPEVTEEQFQAMMEKTEESETTEEVKKIIKKATRKPRRVAGSIEFVIDEITKVNLTPKQVDFIRHLPDTHFWEHGIDSEIWIDCLCDEVGGQFAGKPMTVGAMISTLCEKGLGIRTRQKVDNRTATSFKLTHNGKMVALQIGVQ